jgi:hypothetical protein
VGIGVSVFLLAVGAVLTFAVHPSVPDASLHTVGVILMVAGAVGMFIAAIITVRRGPVATKTTKERIVERDQHPARGA